MTNVVQFPAQETKVSVDASPLSPERMLAGASSLWRVGAISTDGFFLAAQVAYLLVVADKPVVSMSWNEATARVVFNGEDLIAGPISCNSLESFGFALLELHVCVGLINGLDKKFFNPAGNPRQHFTIPHPMRRSVLWHADTPIFFRLDNFDSIPYAEFITRQIARKLENTTTIRLVQR